MSQGLRASQVDGKGREQHQNRHHARLDMHAAEKQTVKCFINNVERRQRQQAGRHECGEILELSVTVRMPLVGRLVRHPNR